MKPAKTSRVPISQNQFNEGAAAGFYDEHARRFMAPVYRRFAIQAAGLKAPGNRVLDIGTGNGLLLIEILKARPDWNITGIDISGEMLKLAGENASKAGISGKIDFIQASADALPFTERQFDVVISNASLHLWKDPVGVFNEIARVTAPGGRLLLWDNLRLPFFYPLFHLLGWLMGMNESQRILWVKAIKCSYNAGEASKILKQSALKEARVKTDYSLIELNIEWQKPLASNH
jgi:ubiquinone/menaquinone biosynthesis C-methylase UbiE